MCSILEQAERDVVVDQPIVGGVLGIERGDRRFFLEALTPCAIERLLRGDALGADVVEFGVELNHLAGLGIFVLMKARIRSIDRRQRQRFFHELIGKLSESRVTHCRCCLSLCFARLRWK